MKYEKFTQNSREALEYATQLAQSSSHAQIEGLHLVKALLAQRDEGITEDLLKEANIDIKLINSNIDNALEQLPRLSGQAAIYMSNELHKALNSSFDYSKQFKDEYVSFWPIMRS